MEERRSLADGEEEEEEEEDEDEDMSPQKLRTMIKEGIEVAILIILNVKILTTMMTRTTQRKALCFPLLRTVAGVGLWLLLLFSAIWYLYKIQTLTFCFGSL